MKGYKFVRLLTAEWAVRQGMGEGPMFGSPRQSNEDECQQCIADKMAKFYDEHARMPAKAETQQIHTDSKYTAISYQVGRVEAHHFHENGGGIYHFDLFDQRLFASIEERHMELRSQTSKVYESPWLLDLECASDCTGIKIAERRRIQLERSKSLSKTYILSDQSISTASYVDVKAVLASCAICKTPMPVGRMAELYGSMLVPVCELHMHGYIPYHTWFNNTIEPGQVMFLPVADSKHTSKSFDQPLSGWHDPPWRTNLQAQYESDYRVHDHKRNADYYQQVELEQRQSELIHEITLEQMKTAQKYRREMAQWKIKLDEVTERLRQAQEGQL